jgi:hypothetical protein
MGAGLGNDDGLGTGLGTGLGLGLGLGVGMGLGEGDGDGEGAGSPTVVETVELLFPVFGSNQPSGNSTWAEFATEPAADPVPVTVMTTEFSLPERTVTGRRMALPLPPLTPQAACPKEAQVQATPVMLAGTLSLTTTLKALAGPLLWTVRV